MLSTYLSTIWSFLNSSVGTTIIKEGTSNLFKGLIDRWKEKKSKNPSLTEDDLKKDLEEHYNEEQLKMLANEIKKMKSDKVVIEQDNVEGDNSNEISNLSYSQKDVDIKQSNNKGDNSLKISF